MKTKNVQSKQSSLIYKNFEIQLDNTISHNWIIHDKTTFVLSELSKKKGGNSFTFNIKNDEYDMIIKFCKYYEPNSKLFFKNRIKRFNNEINALKIAKSKKIPYIIEIIDDGVLEIDSMKFKFYIMEKAHSDLTEQILDNDCFDLQGKVQLSLQIIEGISELNAIGIYHRDIKPDNILFVNEIWKIGDLGLCSYKNKFADIDKSGEKIGPIGFLSPEAANKFFTEKRLPGKFDCTIDDKSDIFQLGKVLWFIFKRNVPFGQLIVDDFGNSDIYEVIEMMLQFSKERRADYAFILGKFQQISKEFKLS